MLVECLFAGVQGMRILQSLVGFTQRFKVAISEIRKEIDFLFFFFFFSEKKRTQKNWLHCY